MKRLNLSGIEVIFDVGANVGKWSLEAQSIFKSGRIFAFEPMPKVFLVLKANVSDRKGIQIFNYALSNTRGILTFNYYPDAILFSSIYSHFSGGKSIQIKVEGIDGDGFCMENDIAEIDFLKIDAEGSEHLILEGFKAMLMQRRIKALQFEYGIFSIESKFLLKDFYNLFSEYGYVLGKIYPNHVDFRPYDWTMENFIGPNFVAVRSNETELINSLK